MWTVEESRPPPAAGVAYAAKFNSRLAKHLNCTRSAVPLAPSKQTDDGCAPLVAYIFEGDDTMYSDSSLDLEAPPKIPQTPEQPQTLMWGIADGRTGRLKYSIRSGKVFAPADLENTDTSGDHHMLPPGTTVLVALAMLALLITAVQLILKVGFFSKPLAESASFDLSNKGSGDEASPTDVSGDDHGSNGSNGHHAETESWWTFLGLGPRPKPKKRRTPTADALEIIRSTRFTAEENLRDDRSRRLRERGYGSSGIFSRSYYLHRIAEGPSPLPSDDEDAVASAAAAKRQPLLLVPEDLDAKLDDIPNGRTS